MTITYNATSGAQVCASAVSTFASWPVSPYDWSISVGTQIPASGCRMNDTQFVDADYRTFICLTSSNKNCNGQDWGYSTYPTYSQANSVGTAYFVDFSINGGVVTVNNDIPTAYTRIDTISPSGNATTSTTTSQAISITGFISNDDYATGTKVTVYVSRDSSTQQTSALMAWESAGAPYSAYFEFPITSPGYFSLSTTTDTSSYIS